MNTYAVTTRFFYAKYTFDILSSKYFIENCLMSHTSQQLQE